MSNDVFVVVEHVQGEVADITYVMLAAARQLAADIGGSVKAILMGHGAQGLADSLGADAVLYVDDPALAEFTSDAYQRTVSAVIEAGAPRVVLFGDTTVGADIAGLASARLGLPLVNYCRRVRGDGGAIRTVSQICGGKIVAEGELGGPTGLVLMIPGDHKPDEGRSDTPPEVVPFAAPDLSDLVVTLVRYVEPEAGDVDITREEVLVSVGRGLQQEDNLELATELADALGGAVSASRPVVDQGWLPTSRLVGKSGKRVTPKVYFALGISGAPEHTEAITDSDVIIAINTDPAAPIFDVAQYGAEMDMLDLMPVLTEKVAEAKGG